MVHLSINRGGRPKKEDSLKRSKRVEFRLNEEEFREFRELFVKSGAPTVRRFLMDAYLKRVVVSASGKEAEMFTLLKGNIRDLRSISSNVNQVAAKINSMKGDVSDLVLGYEVKKAIGYLSEISVLEESIVKIADDVSDKFFSK